MKPHPALLPLSWLYGLGVRLRSWLFDRGILPVTRVSRPVISVGNIVVGGSGKTPFVIWLAKRLKRQGVTVAILSRGYGRRTRGFLLVSNGTGPMVSAQDSGDEPFEIASSVSGVLVAVAEDRVQGATRLIEEYGAEVVVLDDGFQHRALHRDLDILLMPADRNSALRLLPAGILREPLSAVRRAHLVIATQCRTNDDIERVQQMLRTSPTIVGMTSVVAEIVDARTNETLGVDAVHGKRVVVVSGIAHPERFIATVSESGAVVVGRCEFADHHWFTAEDIARVQQELRRTQAEMLLTTSKDAARMTVGMQSWRSLPLYVVKTQIRILRGENQLEAAVQGVLRRENRSWH